ncbi:MULTISPECIES: DUF2971 domain-containing protein [Serratia]|uniref:DUF2971 domain-containing protein n=1 Tax=Serratia TaxID=613 RepID=UPI00186742DE|nr:MULTISPECIES: DUF2971 domain-containing protein [Serratia]ELH4208217.1 DUF2971 domain-containing protein [Serratia marcescens]MBH2567252.1 DUF2971 domain-containing protein [Serratia marcescens]MBH2854280.1 DUF2971 domain-containing protein [Serratia marcescens]MDB6448964.1 DUF2971 domain-containing protein [Serratia sp. 21NM0010]HEJ6945817.1 DUF2971 domain-containing protein [Serratia marcescens]
MVQIPRSRILFKYRKFDKSCLELLLNRELWFASPATLNDPFEAESSIHEVLDAVWARYPIPTTERKAYEEYLHQQLSSAGICSFSKARKNQLMWSHYADEHKGVCIGFKEHKIRPHGSYIYPIDVTYQDEYPFEEIIERFNYFEHIYGMNNLKSIAGDILISILGTKYTSWKYERERRLVFVKSIAHKFEPDAVNSIAFGLRMAERDRQTLRNLLSGAEWDHVKWFQSIKSATKYSLEFERVK